MVTKKKPAKKAAAKKKPVRQSLVAVKRPAAKRPAAKTAHAPKVGRKPLSSTEATIGRSLRMPESYWLKVDKLGGAQVIRDAVKLMPAKLPKAA